MTPQDLQTRLDALPASPRMPALFIGHGSPMNAIEDTPYSESWRQLGASLPRPAAILVVSAHWTTRSGTLAHAAAQPKTIHDFSGFPPELHAQTYPAPGAPAYAEAVAGLIPAIGLDQAWGLDHGSWSVLIQMYPKADIPVFQLSLDLSARPDRLFALWAQLRPLRDKGVLILGSGNLVHNLRAMSWAARPHDWALAFDERMAAAIAERDLATLQAPETLGPIFRLAHPSAEHLWPMLLPLAVADPADELRFFTEGIDLGAISMRSFILS